MRVLRLGNSADNDPNVPDDERMHVIAGRLFTAETNEPVEHVLRVAWPSPELPGLLDGWLTRYEPDMVVFVVNGFWFNYQSVPLKLERKLGQWVRPLTTRGRAVAARAWPGESRVFRIARNLLLRTIGGATYFTPPEVLAVTEACIKVTLARESVAMVVRGPLSPIGADTGEQRKRTAEQRRLLVHAGLEALCARYHLQYVGRQAKMDDPEWQALSRGDGLHLNTAGHQGRGQAEGRAMLATWSAGEGES